MSNIPYPHDFFVDYAAERRWDRQQAILRGLDVGDVLAEVDDLIALEADPAHHPLYSLAAHALDRTTQPGTAEALQARLGRLIDHAIERLLEQRLAQDDD